MAYTQINEARERMVRSRQTGMLTQAYRKINTDSDADWPERCKPNKQHQIRTEDEINTDTDRQLDIQQLTVMHTGIHPCLFRSVR